MKNNNLIAIGVLFIIIVISFSFFLLLGIKDENYGKIIYLNSQTESFPFKKQSNGYSGWQMGCNYALGSKSDWDEKTQQYGDQRFLECANGITYERISK